MIKYTLFFILHSLIISADTNYDRKYTLTIGENVFPYLVYYTNPIIGKVLDIKEKKIIDSEDKYVMIIVVSIDAFKGIKTRFLKLPTIKNVFKVYIHKYRKDPINARQIFQEVNKTYDEKNLLRKDSDKDRIIMVKDHEYDKDKFDLSVECEEIQYSFLEEVNECKDKYKDFLSQMEFCLKLIFKDVYSDDDYNIELIKNIKVVMELSGPRVLNKVEESFK